MISLADRAKKELQELRAEYKKLSDAHTFGREFTEGFYNTKKMEAVLERLKELTPIYHYLKTGYGIQEDTW